MVLDPEPSTGVSTPWFCKSIKVPFSKFLLYISLASSYLIEFSSFLLVVLDCLYIFLTLFKVFLFSILKDLFFFNSLVRSIPFLAFLFLSAAIDLALAFLSYFFVYQLVFYH